MDVIDRYLAVHEHALTVRSHRSTLLAGNLVNVDTPGFQPRDINFTNALNDLMRQRVESSATLPVKSKLNNTVITPASILQNTSVPNLNLTLRSHAATKNGDFIPLTAPDSALNAHVHYRDVLQVAADGNGVDSEKERSMFTENALRIEAGIQLLTMRIGGLIKAIRGD